MLARHVLLGEGKKSPLRFRGVLLLSFKIPGGFACLGHTGYDQFQANYPALTSWPMCSPSLAPLRSL